MKCFIDLDGVLANFSLAASLAHGRPFPYDKKENLGEYRIEKIWNKSTEEFWEPLNGADFWASIPIMTDAREIVTICEERFREINCCILTSPSLDPESPTGKLRWINEHFPEYNRRVLIGACKEFCAHRGAILIDDSLVNVAKFCASGGRGGVTLPRPWNEYHSVDPIEDLLRSLEQI